MIKTVRLPLTNVVWALVGIAAFSAVIGYRSISAQLTKLSAQVNVVSSNLRSREATKSFIDEDRQFQAELTYCSRSGSPFCELVKFQTYDQLGPKPPLWVLFDALHQLGYVNSLDQDTRSQFNRLITDISATLNIHGAIDYLSQRDVTGWQSSQMLYVAVLTHADLCAKGMQQDCRRGLPVTIENAIRRTADFVEKHGKRQMPYAYMIREPALRLIDQVMMRQSALSKWSSSTSDGE